MRKEAEMTGRRVLVITEEQEVAERASTTLRHAGYSVSWVRTPAKGVQRAISEQPDVIVVDLRLRRDAGHLALGFLRRSFRTSHIPVVVLGSLEHEALLSSWTSVPHVPRSPLDPMALISSVREGLDQAPLPTV